MLTMEPWKAVNAHNRGRQDPATLLMTFAACSIIRLVSVHCFSVVSMLQSLLIVVGVKVGAAPAVGALQGRGQQVGHCLRSTRRHV
jgi:hypothetical protein